jgi:hypothetical protein
MAVHDSSYHVHLACVASLLLTSLCYACRLTCSDVLESNSRTLARIGWPSQQLFSCADAMWQDINDLSIIFVWACAINHR